MAKKKTRYPNRGKKIARACAVLGAVIVLAGAGTGGALWLNYSAKSWVMEFDGRKISAETLRYFAEDIAISGASATGDYKADGYEAMRKYLIMEKAAGEHGYARSEEDLAAAASSALEYKSYLEGMSAPVPKLADGEWAELLSAASVDRPLYERYTDSYTVDEAAFEADFEDYYQNDKAKYVNASLKYIYNADEALIEEAEGKMAEGMTFDEAVIAYSSLYTEGEAIPELELKTLSLNKEATDKILALAAGERTGKISLGDEANPAFAIFEAQSMDVPPKEEVRAAYLEEYTAAAKEELFNAELEKFAAGIVITKNGKGYDALNLFE